MRPGALASVENQAAGAGRVCPRDYRYPPSVFDRAPEFSADTLYVIGGLYGNLQALQAVEALTARERGPVTLVFNGDFHWFDAEPDWFSAIERGVAPHRCLRGNVETEIARDGDVGAGCGCAYPDEVDDATVARSNAILADLRAVARATPDATARLAALPMHRVAAVGDLRIGIVHGDAVSLAGWRFAHDRLDAADAAASIADIAAAARVDVFASTHTCLAALRDVAVPGGRLTVVNNGAAGMPNFAGARAGLVSRIATTPAPVAPLYGLRRGGVHIDAVPLDYDVAAFDAAFLARWPEGSPAHRSYRHRIVAGPSYTHLRARPR